MVTKVGVARGITATYLLLQYQKEMRDNYAKGNWLEAAKDTGWLALTLTPVVAPNFFFGTVAFPVLTGAAIGVGATMIIAEATGMGTAEEVLDLVLDPPTDWLEVVAPAVEQKYKEFAKKSDDFQIAAAGWVDRRLMDAQHYLEREYQEKKMQVETGWELLNKYGRWANPIRLPF